jgi:microcystin-dependent protein
LGQKSGEETNTLSAAEMPQHSHQWRATVENAITPAADPANKLFGTGNVDMYTNNVGTLVDMANGTMTNVGGGQAHNNMQPYTTLNFCIAVRGLFPSRN